ncbi:uncharacterized protein G2W53_029159 [Senna tora]|uniref:Reverse transcriptase domain-containing protein n=1 Tax=Senna tora TaxID=362788 RepID=A0A834T562_9FABA|nr:uncharacterized protein G2W53_029159 [Senna tora]
MHFPSNWIQLIYNLLINGNLTVDFQPSCGIRQGDPISSHLYILCANVLSCLNKKEVEAKLWRGIKIGGGTVEISHLMYADDTMLFFEVNDHNVQSIQRVLDKYAVLAGQRMNSSKSFLVFSPNTPHRLKRSVAETFGVIFFGCTGKCLGTWIDHHKNKRDILEDVVDKIQSKLQDNLPTNKTLRKHHIQLMKVVPSAFLRWSLESMSFSNVNSFARDVWFGTHLALRTDCGTSTDLRQWFNGYYRSIHEGSIDKDSIRFICIFLQLIWRCKNLRVMGGTQIGDEGLSMPRITKNTFNGYMVEYNPSNGWTVVVGCIKVRSQGRKLNKVTTIIFNNGKISMVFFCEYKDWRKDQMILLVVMRKCLTFITNVFPISNPCSLVVLKKSHAMLLNGGFTNDVALQDFLSSDLYYYCGLFNIHKLSCSQKICISRDFSAETVHREDRQAIAKLQNRHKPPKLQIEPLFLIDLYPL